MRILQICSGNFFSTYGGGQVYVRNIIDTMIDMGSDICIVSFTDVESPIIKKYRDHPLIEIPNNISEQTLKKIIADCSPDVIHAHSHKSMVCNIGSSLYIPTIVTSHHGGILCPAGSLINIHDDICQCKISHKNCLPCTLRNVRSGLHFWYPFIKYLPQSSYLKLGRILSGKTFIPFITPIGIAAATIANKIDEWNIVAKKCTCMIAPCHEMAKAMIRNGLDANKTLVIPHGIPLPKIVPDFPHIKNGKIKFFYVGRICYIKGIHIMLKAFSQVKDPQIELHLIGGAANKSEKRYMRKLQHKYNQDQRIIWQGKVSPDKVYETIADMHISCSFSHMESFGLNIAESLAMGKPVLATRSGGAEMQIKDGKNGWLIPTNDCEAARKKIVEITQTNPSQLSLMATYIPANSITNHCHELLNVYNSQIKQ